ELPAAVHLALAGRPKLLEHVAALVGRQSAVDVNEAVLLATTCNDGPFPWSPETSLAARAPLLARAVEAAGALGGLGSWAARGAAPRSCPRVQLPIAPVPALPATVTPATTLAATIATLREAEATWLTGYPAGWAVGLEGCIADGRDFDVVGYSAYSDVPGLAVS